VTVYLAKRAKAVENLQAFEQPSTAVNVTVRKSAPREYLTESVPVGDQDHGRIAVAVAAVLAGAVHQTLRISE
jgi:hypothetical protein